jgi:hypothetical protein
MPDHAATATGGAEVSWEYASKMRTCTVRGTVATLRHAWRGWAEGEIGMSSRDAGPGVEAAAAYLRQLLGESGRYRDRWEARARRARAGEIDDLAVARVLADHLSNVDRSAKQSLPPRLRRAVSRAITGQALDARMLHHVIQAFGIAEQDADRLWQLYSHDDERPWRTLALQEYHHVGADGVPVEHQTRHVLVAIRDGVDRYPFRFDTDQLSVSMVRGGTASEPYPTGDGLFAVDILFSKPLKRGEPIGFEYDVAFHYRDPPAPELRRAVRGWLESLSVSVRFHPEKVPRAVWWATWSDYRSGGRIVDRTRVQLDGDNTVFNRMKDVEGTVVGFCWEW